MLTKEKFGHTEVQQNHLVESPDIRPHFYLKAVEYLKGKCMFNGAASTQVDCLLKSLKDQKEQEKVENQNKDKKAKSLAKQKVKERQKTSYI